MEKTRWLAGGKSGTQGDWFVAGSWYWQFVRKNDANLKCSEGWGELNRPFLIY